MDPLFGLGLLKLFLDTIDGGPSAAAKGVATMSMGGVGTAIDVAETAWALSGSQPRNFGEAFAQLLVDPDANDHSDE